MAAVCNELRGAILPPLGTLPSPSWPGPGGGERQEAEKWMRRNDADVTVGGMKFQGVTGLNRWQADIGFNSHMVE